MADNFKLSQDYELILPQKQRSYPIFIIEWELIKSKVAQVKDDANLWQTIGSLLIGTAIPTLITALSGNFENEKATWICWSAFIITSILGCFAYYFGKEQRKSQNLQKEDVIDYMNSIEARFNEIARVSPTFIIKSAKYGANETFVDITQRISDVVAGNVYAIKASNKLVDGIDPIAGTKKKLIIEYSKDGVDKTLLIPENQIKILE